jgi:tripartite-type tricarboxylate transporter receptor subunit TctC
MTAWRILAAVPLLLLLASSIALAQVPMKIVVPFAAGGGGDLIARVLAPRLSQELGRPVIVENKAGASGQVGMQFVQAAVPDGATVVFASDQASIVTPLTSENARYDTAKDFVGLGRVAQFPYALAVPASSGIDSMQALTTWLKANPAKANAGLPAVGGLPEMVATAVGRHAGVAVTSIPYNGAAPMVAPLLGGQLTTAVLGFNNVFPLHKEGKLKVIAVTGAARFKLAPSIATFDELGLNGLRLVSTWTFYAPAKTPRATVERFNAVLNRILAEPEVVEKINGIYMEVTPTSIEQTQAELRSATMEWTELLKRQGTLAHK